MQINGRTGCAHCDMLGQSNRNRFLPSAQPALVRLAGAFIQFLRERSSKRHCSVELYAQLIQANGVRNPAHWMCLRGAGALDAHRTRLLVGIFVAVVFGDTWQSLFGQYRLDRQRVSQSASQLDLIRFIKTTTIYLDERNKTHFANKQARWRPKQIAPPGKARSRRRSASRRSTTTTTTTSIRPRNKRTTTCTSTATR